MPQGQFRWCSSLGSIVEAGLALSVSPPGGNVTGINSMQTDMIGKRLELLKELLPQVSNIGIVVRAINPAVDQYVQGSLSPGSCLSSLRDGFLKRNLGHNNAPLGGNHK